MHIIIHKGVCVSYLLVYLLSNIVLIIVRKLMCYQLHQFLHFNLIAFNGIIHVLWICN